MSEITPDGALVGAAQRAAADGRERFLLIAEGPTGGTMTYGTVFPSSGAVQDEVSMLRGLGQDATLYMLTARPDGKVAVDLVAA